VIEVVMYSRDGCHLCDEALEALSALQEKVPHTVRVIDIDQDERLKKKYDQDVPVVVIGPYTLRAPIHPQDLEITLRALKDRQEKDAALDLAIQRGEISIPVSWGKADRFSLWLSRNYLTMFNLFVFFYVGLAFLAPVLMKVGWTTPANWLYRSYGYVCHQLAFRSWFLFGEQTVYPRSEVNLPGVIPYGEATHLDEADLLSARSFIGDEFLGYKIALCERDVSIYLGILAFGLVFSASGRRIKSIPWFLWVVLGLAPIGFDGVSQLISQPPLSLIPFRESTPLLRAVTGGMFGFFTAWFGYPMAEESMRETRDFMEQKLKRHQAQQGTVKPAAPELRM